MKPVLVMLISLVLVLGVIAPTVPLSAAEEDGDDGLAPIVEQIDVMRLVLANAINKRFAQMRHDRITEIRADEVTLDLTPDPESAAELYEAALTLRSMYTYAGSGTNRFTSHTRGFYAEGTGIIFTSEVETPLRLIERTDEDAPPAPDEWEEALEEVRRNRDTTGATLAATDAYLTALEQSAPSEEAPIAVIDDEFVDAAIEVVLTILGKHGLRIEGLPSDESIIVALRLTPDEQTTAWYTKAPLAGATEGDAATVSLMMSLYSSSYVTAARVAEPRHLVVTIPKSALNRIGGDEGDVEALRQAAVVTRY